MYQRQAAEGAEHILTVAADTPFFPADLQTRLVAARDAAGLPIALAATPGPDRLYRHPTFGLWPVGLRGEWGGGLRGGLGKVVLWAVKHGWAEALFPVDPFDPFFNINRPEDLAQAEAMA